MGKRGNAIITRVVLRDSPTVPHLPHDFGQFFASVAANMGTLQYLATAAQGLPPATPELTLSAQAPAGVAAAGTAMTARVGPTRGTNIVDDVHGMAD